MKPTIFMALTLSALVLSLLTFTFGLASQHSPSARMIDPIVSTDWLDSNKSLPTLVVLDIRSAEAYKAGHIPNAINKPFLVPISEWIIVRDDLLLEVPEKTALFSTIGSLGIGIDSLVVVVTEPNPGQPPFYGLSNATRVALTLIYAGVRNVAILDGGYPKWVANGLAITDVTPALNPVIYQGKTDEAMFVSTDYVRKHTGKADILDARDANVYFGVAIEPFAAKAGHIPTARCLPAPWIWDQNKDGSYTYKGLNILKAMASGVQRKPEVQETIVYCGVGGYASTWWYVLTQLLGYQNVKIYDGAAQEWVRHYDMVPYQWD